MRNIEHNMDSAVPGWRDRWAFAAVGVVVLLAIAASLQFATWLDGPGSPEARRLDTGWFYLRDGVSEPIDSLPCTLDVEGESLVLCRDLTEEEKLHSRYVLTIRSRYASVRVWADDALIYEAAQGREHALGSMWHFIPMSACAQADRLTVELQPYGSDTYTVESMLLDTPGAIRYALLWDNGPVILFGSVCLLLAISVLTAAALLRRWKSQAYAPLLAFALLLLLSGAWILLDSKITTMGGGNYAVSYFLSYAAFYLLDVPFLLYVRQMTPNCRRLLTVLIWAVILNAGLSMALHMAGLVELRHTAVIVHALILVSLPVSTAAFWDSAVRRRERRLRFSFLGQIAVYVFGLVSIALYHLDRLPAAKSTSLYMVGLSILIAGMAVDMISSFGKFWRTKEAAEHYRRLAVVDIMTEMGNRNAFQGRLDALLEQNPEQLAFVAFDVDDLKRINDQMGHHVGDQAIYTAALCIRAVFDAVGYCHRIGGDEFMVILTGKPVSQIPELLSRFQREVKARWDDRLPSCGISYGWASAAFSAEAPLTVEDLTRLQAEADRSLYQRKQERKAGR